jgi:aldehyde dehydrogenase (NAD+)
MIERAKQDGARLITGGSRLGGEFSDGYYLQPTVFADVDPTSELAQTEVFGPVLSIIPFDDDDQAIEIANGTPYGLSGYVFTRDLRRAHRVAEELETGEVLINGAINLGCTRPFGGIGISGMGKEGGRQGLEEFLQIKTVSMA